MKNIEFAKWDRRVDPETYREKRNLTKEIAKNKGVITSKLKEKISEKKRGAKAGKEVWDFLNRYHRERNIPGYNKKKYDTIYYVDQENRQQRIKELSGKAKNNPRIRETPYIKEIPKTTKSNTKIITKVSSNSNKSKSYKETVKTAKEVGTFISKNRKIGLGIAGAAALGSIGYGIARKIRSDKGRKRK